MIPLIATAAEAGVSSIVGSITGSGEDAKRQARCNKITSLALPPNNSVTAARVILAGPSNVASHETGMWTSAVAQLSQTMVSAAYGAGGPFWPEANGDNWDMTNTLAQINAEVQQNRASSAIASGAQSLPAVTTTATRPTSSVWPYAIAAAVVLLLVVFFILRRR